jgi:hypothetical protein
MPASDEASWEVRRDDSAQETDKLDFKIGFDPSQRMDWCELVKDIVAMANSGGGTIVIGANDDGSSSGQDISKFLALDHAEITDKIHKYTEQQFAGFRVDAGTIRDARVAVLSIEGVRFPIVFENPGEYEHPVGKKRSAFGKGTIYFRHGAKSEPGTTDDLRHVLERELARVKEFWLDGITKVVEAPSGSEIHVVQTAVAVDQSGATQKIRLTSDGSGPEFKVVDNDQLYPYRAKELLARLVEAIGPKVASTYDIQLVRKIHAIDENPNYSHKGKFGTRQYSDAFIEWLTVEYTRDSQFFQKCRLAARATRD